MDYKNLTAKLRNRTAVYEPYRQAQLLQEAAAAIEALQVALTVGAVEVVRCKECKHFVSPQGVPVCDYFYGLGFPDRSGDDFCSYGERRLTSE